jgi:phosphodiesterase/alkaline phosphatase D-like protein
VVRYGTSPTALTSEVAVTTASVSQTAAITNLQSRAKYYYRIEATNDAGQKVSTPVTEFRTRNR